MDIFQQVLKKAEKEGQMDPRLVAAMSGKKTRFWNVKKLPLPPMLMTLPENVIYDLQKIMENIRQLSESKSARIIGFTSAIPEQGTSSVISLISLLMAAREKMSYEQIQDRQNGGNGKYPYQHGVLLIDAQLRNPSLHHKFGLQQSGGILEVLENELPTHRLIKSLENSALKIVTTGVYKNFSLAQNHLEKMEKLLANASRRVKFIFIDIPPVLAYSEGISLSRLCDGLVLVMRAGEIRWEVMQEARRHLERADIPIFGGILNRREYHIPSWVYRNI
jgi:Mrp family chromosome partitioning ATPase